MKRIFYCLLATALLATGCIYDFTPEVGGDSDNRVVIEADLLIGEVCQVNLSYVMPLSGSTTRRYPQKPISVYLEGENGSRYDGKSVYSQTATLDLSTAKADTRYRLHVTDNDSAKEYVTEWMDVNKAAVIDDLTYIPGDGVMNVGISMHATNQKYFRWRYEEIWEYHSLYRAAYYYTPNAQLPDKERGSYPFGKVSEFQNDENIYYCWANRQSSEILIFTTKEQKDDRFVDLEFHSIPQSDNRLSILYYIKVYVTTLSEDAYNYWKNIQTNSDYNGSLFAPNPSEMTGNISCVQNPTEQVLGFVYVSETVTEELFIDNYETDFYKEKKSNNEEPETCEDSSQWYSLYRQGKLPVECVSEEPVQYSWVSKYCVDCRLSGGTKNKPAFWPNYHK